MNTETITTKAGQTFVPGIQGFSNASAPLEQNPNAVSPNAIRWLFNPFAYIDVSGRPVTGHLHLQAGVFIPITSQNNLIALPNQPALTPQAMYGVGNDLSYQQVGMSSNPMVTPPGYRSEPRTAYAIASELEDAYTDKGLRILPSLTKFDDMAAVSAIYKTFVEEGLIYTPDPYQPGYPVPNLVALESYLVNTAAPKAATFTDDLAVSPSAVIADILVAIRTALQTCRNVTREGKRVVANKTTGYTHVFDAYHTRCFLALGESVPSDLPFVSEQGHMVAAGQGVAADTSEIKRLRDENEQLKAAAAQRRIAELEAENARLKLANEVGPSAAARLQPDTAEVSTEKIVAQCDFTKKSGEQCKGRANPETGRCSFHPINDEQKENENVNESQSEIESVQ